MSALPQWNPATVPSYPSKQRKQTKKTIKKKKKSSLQSGAKNRTNRKQADSRQLTWKIHLFIGLVAVFVGTFFLLNNMASIMTNNYKIISLQQQLTTQQSRNEDLSAEVDALNSPARIMQLARQQLHLQFTTPIFLNH
jgi:cell division protein FtsL